MGQKSLPTKINPQFFSLYVYLKFSLWQIFETSRLNLNLTQNYLCYRFLSRVGWTREISTHPQGRKKLESRKNVECTWIPTVRMNYKNSPDHLGTSRTLEHPEISRKGVYKQTMPNNTKRETNCPKASSASLCGGRAFIFFLPFSLSVFLFSFFLFFLPPEANKGEKQSRGGGGGGGEVDDGGKG